MLNFGNLETRMKGMLQSLKIFDADNTLSLTSVGVMVLIGKIATAPNIDWPTTASLMLALLSYNFKRKLNAEKAAAELADEKTLQSIEDKIAEINKAFAVQTMFKK